VQVGDLVREKTRMKRKCSLGVVLEVALAPVHPVAKWREEEYLVHFFDDDDKCWMSNNFLERL